jgi:PilZ domain
VDIEIEWRSKIVWGRVENISREGMFIELDDVLDPGEQFFGNLALNVPLRVVGVVRRTVPHYGIGVSFVIPQPADQRRFAALLIALAQGSDSEAAGVQLPQAQPEEPLCCVAASAASGPAIGRHE